MILNLCYLIIAVVAIIGMWKTFEKCGEPGWASLIPIYNIIVMMRIAKWEITFIKVILFFIPIVQLYFFFMLYKDIAAKFGKTDILFPIGLLFLPFIFFPILGFKEEVVA